MGKIYIVGLGPGDENLLSLGAVKRINSGVKNFIRTVDHEAVDYFKNSGIPFVSFDSIYETKEDFESVYSKIAEIVVKEAENCDVNYFVPGNPMVAEKTVSLIKSMHEDVEIVSGMSFIEPIIEAVGIDVVDGMKIINGDDFDYCDFSIHTPTIVVQVYNDYILEDLKIAVQDLYGDEHESVLIKDAGIKGKELIQTGPAYTLGRGFKVNNKTSLYIPPVSDSEYKDHTDLIKVIKRLRGEGGCPWDRKQTHKSMKSELIEESYEVIDAIDSDDYNHLMEELGDLLLQAFFHMEIAFEEGEFLPNEVYKCIVDKLIYRHPHVFGDLKVSDSNAVLDNWDKLKSKERMLTSFSDKLRDIAALPSLMRAQKFSKKMMGIGFKWETVDGAFEKLHEEIDELEKAYYESADENAVYEEIGDVLFSVANIGQYLGIDLELCLNDTLSKILKRFDIIEDLADNRGIDIQNSSLEVLDSLWREAKKKM